MFRPKRYFDFMRLWVLLTGFIWTTVALPHTAAAQDTVEPANNTVWTTTLANPNPNNFDTPNIMSALFNPHSDLVMLSAHRGIHALAGLSQAAGVPENSLQSIGLAAQAGWEMIELDVKLTSDGVPILSHDKTWGREWCGLGSVFSPGSANPYNPFTPPGSIFNDAKNPAVNGTLLSDTRSFLGNTVLRDSVSLLNAVNNGCNGFNNAFGEYPPTLADALDYISKNHIRMVVLLDIQGIDVARAALPIVKAKNDDLGRSFLTSAVFKMPATLFPNGTTDFFTTFGSDSQHVIFIPVINTANVAPTTTTITDTEDGGFDVTDFGNNGFGGEQGIVNWLASMHSGPVQMAAVEVNLKEPGGILTQTVLPAAKQNQNQQVTVGAFNPVGEFYPNGDTTQTPQFFRSSNGSCCDILDQYLYNNPNGTGPIDPTQPVDHSDQRTNLSFLLSQGFQYLITDDPTTASNLLQQQNKRNLCYMQLPQGQWANCTQAQASAPAPACQAGNPACLSAGTIGTPPTAPGSLAPHPRQPILISLSGSCNYLRVLRETLRLSAVPNSKGDSRTNIFSRTVPMALWG
ncbi:glycerophosphodiester phosphodiesterase family protein [Tunturibacter empetritectus]|uniref:Glucosylceramidase n=1 Tax=Tunturiibacter empetritectus TaxID=3069691 RepID=A0A7W8ILP1_9BACT|nr:glycerophosphodiester phosphodiesterase family protein [Edaphobacter lichenicola]MBB5319404.1 glucosylceramidase [Edaphobacter lichenicola]